MIYRMKVSDLSYGGVQAWPPAWTSSLPATSVLVGQVEPLLTRVAVSGVGLDIEITIEGNTFRGRLLWDGPPAPHELKQLLDGYVNRPLREAGEANIPRVYDKRRRA
jgi:hypothetical protein